MNQKELREIEKLVSQAGIEENQRSSEHTSMSTITSNNIFLQMIHTYIGILIFRLVNQILPEIDTTQVTLEGTTKTAI